MGRVDVSPDDGVNNIAERIAGLDQYQVSCVLAGLILWAEDNDVVRGQLEQIIARAEAAVPSSAVDAAKAAFDGRAK